MFLWNFYKICGEMQTIFVQIFKHFDENFVLFLHQFLEKILSNCGKICDYWYRYGYQYQGKVSILFPSLRQTSTSDKPQSGRLLEKKDSVWYATGINQLINQYEKCLSRYGAYVKKLVITWRITFCSLRSMCWFFVENGSVTQNFQNTLHMHCLANLCYPYNTGTSRFQWKKSHLQILTHWTWEKYSKNSPNL